MKELLIKHRGGMRNIHVVKYNTISDLPTIAQENTIALISTADIGNIFYQVNEPDQCNINDVWIYMNSSYYTLNFTVGNVFTALGLFDAYIKTSTDWVPIETWAYQNKEWKMISSGIVYYEGKEYEVYTGSWTTFDRTSKSGDTAQPKHPIVIRNEDNIEAITLETSDASGSGMFCTAEKIDLTPYSTIVFEGTFLNPYGDSYPLNFVAGAWSKIPDLYYNQDRLAYYEMNATSKTKITVDITDINTSAYIGFGIKFSKVILTRCYLTPKEEI